MIEQVEEIIAERGVDAQGLALLADAYLRLGWPSEAWRNSADLGAEVPRLIGLQGDFVPPPAAWHCEGRAKGNLPHIFKRQLVSAERNDTARFGQTDILDFPGADRGDTRSGDANARMGDALAALGARQPHQAAERLAGRNPTDAGALPELGQYAQNDPGGERKTHRSQERTARLQPPGDPGDG